MALSCKPSSRVARSTAGSLIDAVAGAALGTGISALLLYQADFAMEHGKKPWYGLVKEGRGFALIPISVGLLGTVTGATIGAWKPQC